MGKVDQVGEGGKLRGHLVNKVDRVGLELLFNEGVVQKKVRLMKVETSGKAGMGRG